MSQSLLAKLCPLPDLEADAFELIRQIPSGRVATYGDLARALGDERASAARWLGELFKNHQHQPECPCHRVVRSNGEIGHYVTGNPEDKKQLLVSEACSVSPRGTVDISAKFEDFRSSKPLQSLKEYQLQLAKKYQVRELENPVKTVAGVDCAYRDHKTAVGAYCELDAESLKVIYQKRITVSVSFPYIPGFLSFRELPTLLKLIDEVRAEREVADVVFVDGNGQLHPWRAGIATCLGVLLDQPTLGIGKSLLCGHVKLGKVQPETPQIVVYDQEVIGNAIQSTQKSKPVYVSSGQFLSLKRATRIAMNAFRSHRVPEPIYYADRLTKYD